MLNAIDNFLGYLQLEKHFSGLTIVSYQADLNQFAQFIGTHYQIADLQEVNAPIIRSYLAGLSTMGMKKSTINRRISSLRSFFRFALRKKLVSQNPMIKILGLTKERKLPIYLDQDATDKMEDYNGFQDGFVGIRDKLLLETFYQTGIRLSELCQIKNSDFNFQDLTIRVIGKGAKQRLVPLLNKYEQQFEEYSVLKYKEFGKLTHDYVFVTNKGLPVYPKFVYRRVNFHLGFITTLLKRSPHILRHTFATHMLNNGAELNAIKEIMGHSSLAATQVYTHNSIEKLKRVFKQAHPRA